MTKLIDFGMTKEREKLEHHPHGLPCYSLIHGDNNSLIILPNSNNIKKLEQLYKKNLWNEISVCCKYIDTNSYMVDQEISENEACFGEIKGVITNLAQHDKIVEFITFEYNEFADNWINRLPFEIDSNIDTRPFHDDYFSKNIFHRHIAKPLEPSLIENLPYIRTPRGYVANTKEQIVSASVRLHSEGISEIIAKPSNGSMGHGIKKIKSHADIDCLNDCKYIIQEELKLDKDIFGLESNCGVAFRNNKVFGMWKQLLKDNSYKGAIFPFDGSTTIKEDITRQIDIFKGFMINNGIKKDGGIDFLLSKNKPFLIDNNLGRMTGTHSILVFQKKYAANMPFVSFRLDTKGEDVLEIWELLRVHDLSFDVDRKMGVFPVRYLPNDFAAMIAFGPTMLSAYHYYEKTCELLYSNLKGYIQNSGYQLKPGQKLGF